MTLSGGADHGGQKLGFVSPLSVFFLFFFLCLGGWVSGWIRVGDRVTLRHFRFYAAGVAAYRY